MLERVRRNSEAAKYQPNASAGMIRCCQPPCPLVGNQCSQTENTRIITSPSQKPGMESPSRATIFPKLSHLLSTRTADTMPAAIPDNKGKQVSPNSHSQQ